MCETNLEDLVKEILSIIVQNIQNVIGTIIELREANE